jgi:N-acetylglucosamine repressor
MTRLADEPNLSGSELKKFRQKKSMLKILYQNRTISVPELSKYLGISMPTAFLLLNDLIGDGLAEIHGTGASTGGRKPAMYRLSDKSLFVIACDMGRYNANMTIYNIHNQCVTPITTIDTHIDDDHLVQKLYDVAQKLIAENHIPKEKIIGLGVDMPGLVDADLGINYTIKNPVRQEIRNHLREKFKMSVYVDNDARMQAFGEYTFGKAKGCRNAVIINWSWGLGLGIILNSRLYAGTTGFAGEFSHMQMVDDGDLCICGKRGCLETVASSNTILKLALDGIKEGKISQLTIPFEKNQGNLTPELVIAAARAGDEFSISILNKVGFMFGKGLSYLIQLLNPEIIVLGGPVAKANQFVLTPIQQALNRYCLEQILQNTRVVISEIDEHAGLLGITAMIYHHYFSEHQML